MTTRVACEHCGIHRDLVVDMFCQCGHSAHRVIVANRADREYAVIAAAQRIDRAVSRGIPVYLGDEIAHELHLACEALKVTVH